MKHFHSLFAALLLSTLATWLHAATDEPHALTVGDRQRLYLLHDFSEPGPAPLVILLHGAGGSGRNAVVQSGFDDLAQREKLVVAYPYGTSRLFSDRLLTWNAGHCCSYALQSQQDDIGFIDALIDSLVAQGIADPERVYVTGLSNGGLMTHLLALALPGKITAAAPVISSLFGDEPTAPVDMPILIINGATDTIMKAEGGKLDTGRIFGRNAADLPILPISSQASFWAARNGCSTQSVESNAIYEHRVFSACRSNAVVEHYIVANNGHAWPGGTAPRQQADQPTTDFSANEVIWAFFSRFP